MFGKHRGRKNLAVGVASAHDEVAVAIVEGATSERPRVIACALLSSQGDELEKFCRERGLRGANCVDSLMPGGYSLMQVDVQNLKPEDRVEAVRWQIRELLDYPAEDAVIDLIDIPLFGSEDKVRNYAIAASKSSLKERVGLAGKLDLRLRAIDIAEMSLRNLLELHQDESRGLCFLWIRQNSSLLTVSRNDKLYFSRLINSGLNQLDIPASPEADAPLSENLQAQLDTIVLEIQRSIDYCESNFRLPQVPKILVAVCGTESPLLLDYLNSYLQAEVAWVDFRQVVDLPLELDSAQVNACLPALGAALRAGGRS